MLDLKGLWWISIFSFPLCAPVRAQSTQRMSVDSVGTQSNGTSRFAAVSADGRYVVFESGATNLVAGDTNGKQDVFVRDRLTGTTVRVSVDSSGAEGDDDSSRAAISADGRYVAFQSDATNLVAGDTNGKLDVFVRDRQSDTTTRVSIATGGAQGNDLSQMPAISADGRFVAFRSAATNFVAGDTFLTDIFVRDRQNSTTERVSDVPGGALGDGSCGPYPPSISADGRFVAFDSTSTNLVAGDTNGSRDVFVRDRQTGATERESVDSGGVEGNNSSSQPALTGDGRFVTFSSLANDLVTPDINASSDVFLRDRTGGTTERISEDSSSFQGNDTSDASAISSDGRYVAFSSLSSNLVSPDVNGHISDVFLRDRQLGTTVRVSLSTTGTDANQNSLRCSIAADGRSVAFDSLATNIVTGDTNAAADVFLNDLSGGPEFAFCFPDVGGVRSCPCLNPPSAANLGCDSFINTGATSGTGGAMLAAAGIAKASVANTLVFSVTKAHNPASNTNLHILWKGTSTLAVGVKSGFGVRCVAGTLKRIYQGTGTGTGGLGSTNAVNFPNGTQTTNAWTASQMPAAGTTLFYYDSFRDQQGPSTCLTANDRFNASHALSVTWSL